jgi:AraC-like DNA-binding protein
LAAMIFLFSFVILAHSIGELQSSGIDKLSHDHLTVQLIFLLFGPLLYFYVKTLTHPQYKLKPLDSLNLLPLVLAFILFIPMQSIIFGSVANPNTIFSAGMIILTIHFTIYIILSIQLLICYERKIKETFSSLKKINLNWLKFIITGLLIIFPFTVVAEIWDGGSAAWNIVWLVVSIFIYAMGFLSFRQPKIYLGSNFSTVPDEERSKKKYHKSSLTGEKIEEYFNSLEKFITENKPYLNSGIDMPALAAQLSISTHHLSQVINEKTGSNFFDYINGYRVKEAMLMLKNPENSNLTITAIGFEAGFNSVSSFNSVFKKIMKTTPSRFRKLNI